MPTPSNGDPWQDFTGHEQLLVAFDQASGMQAVIALHSTALGPALGGVRMSLYADRPEPKMAARQDALRLSRAMTYKNALAGLSHGGGKGVIFGDPTNKSVEVLHAFGRLVSSLNGRYITAGDVGMSVADMDTIGQTCQWTTGRSPENGGIGDSGILTAVGVWQGMRAAAAHVWGTPELAAHLAAEIDRSTWSPLPVFNLIRQLGAVDQLELERTLNMGIGMVSILPSGDAQNAIDLLAARGVSAWVCGVVRARGDGEVGDSAAKGGGGGAVMLVGQH